MVYGVYDSMSLGSRVNELNPLLPNAYLEASADARVCPEDLSLNVPVSLEDNQGVVSGVRRYAFPAPGHYIGQMIHLAYRGSPLPVPDHRIG